MKLSSLFIGILLLAGMAAGILTVYGDFVYQYQELHVPEDILVNTTNITHLRWAEATENVTLITGNISEKIQKIGSTKNPVSAFGESILLIADIGKYFFGFIGVGTNMLNDMLGESRLGIILPIWLLPMLIGILLVIVIFAVVGIFAKRDV